MGVDVATFQYLLEGPGLFAEYWDYAAIPRGDTNPSGEPRPWRRSLDAAGALGLLLHYIGSAMTETSLEQIFTLIPSTVTRYIDFGRNILYDILAQLPECAIKYPQSHNDYKYLSYLICMRHPLLTGAFGSIDGLSLAVQVSEAPLVENATYNSWKSDHTVTNVIVFSPQGMCYCGLQSRNP